MNEKNEDLSQNGQENQEWTNIDKRKYFENKTNFVGYTTALYGQRNLKIYLIISWISAAFTAFISPYFVLVGISFGILSNRIAKGSGNAAIITNAVLAVTNFIFWLLLMFSLDRIFI